MGGQGRLTEVATIERQFPVNDSKTLWDFEKWPLNRVWPLNSVLAPFLPRSAAKSEEKREPELD